MSIQEKLTRQIGLWSLVVYYLSTVIGVGILLVPLQVYRIAGPASLFSWIFVLLMIYPFAIIFAHISQQYQVSGSIQKFLEDSAGKKFGKSIAVFLVITAMFGNFLLGHTAAQYILELLDINNEFTIVPITLIMLTLSIVFNLINLGISSRIQMVGLLSLLVLLEFIVLISIPSFDTGNLVPFMPSGVHSVFGAIIICFYSVVGWENVDAIAEEVSDPRKNYKKAIKIAIGIIAFFYISLALTVTLVINPETLTEKNTVLTLLLNQTLGANAASVGSLFAITLLFFGANVWILGTSRMIFALARDHVFPNVMATVGHKSLIPYIAVLSQMFFYILLGVIVLITNAKDSTITEIASLNYLFLYAIVFFCGFKKFTSHKLRMLSLISLIISSVVLIYSANDLLYYSFLITLASFLYVFFFRKKFVV